MSLISYPPVADPAELVGGWRRPHVAVIGEGLRLLAHVRLWCTRVVGRAKRLLWLGLAAAGVALTAACTTPPLTYPLQLAAPEDATSEIQALVGNPSPPITNSADLADLVARRLVTVDPNCELQPAAHVIWRAPATPTVAAIELRFSCDDATAGTWYEVTMTGDSQAGFTVALATKQAICTRGVSGALCV